MSRKRSIKIVHSRRKKKVRGGGYCSDLLKRKKELTREHGKKAHEHLSKTQKLGYQACRLLFARKSFADYRRFRKTVLQSAPLVIQTTFDAVKGSPYATTEEKSYVTALSETGAFLQKNTDIYEKKDISKAEYINNEKELTKSFEKAVLSIPDSTKTSVHDLVTNTTKTIPAQLSHDDKITKNKLKEKVKKSVKFALYNRFSKVSGEWDKHDWTDDLEYKEEMAPVDYIGTLVKHSVPLTTSDLEQRIKARRAKVDPAEKKYEKTMREVAEEEEFIQGMANDPSFVKAHPDWSDEQRYDYNYKKSANWRLKSKVWREEMLRK